ncbi:hypothetical protein [Variovorax atrisoli]|uniref:hypothetical protein n=1 Tax=Variovorax atrisoli TaxID=3394203 RepID=UPI00160ECF20|nr:hypothetical protein [Variovorax sp. BK613]MBB3642590.1 hypothetical protein [Variovorax sp. BK613]
MQARLLVRVALMTCSALVSVPSWALFKCVVDGKTEYQERPCAGGATQSRLREVAPASAPGAVDVPAELQSAINAGIVGSYPVRGMNQNQLQSALGSPSRVNASDYASGFQEQRIYERPNGTFYVYTRNGIVDSSQFVEAIRPQVVQSARSCPSAFDIKNAEVSANSIALSDAQRKEKLEIVQRMRECR